MNSHNPRNVAGGCKLASNSCASARYFVSSVCGKSWVHDAYAGMNATCKLARSMHARIMRTANLELLDGLWQIIVESLVQVEKVIEAIVPDKQLLSSATRHSHVHADSGVLGTLCDLIKEAPHTNLAM
eukprot:6460708-Amphidinium_carterae.1